jgi:hypothetical protein
MRRLKHQQRVFENGGGTVALKGIAAADARDRSGLLFVVIDGVQLPERRSADRVRVSARARLLPPGPPDDREHVDAALGDLSISGMRVARQPGLVEAAQYRLELYVGEERNPIRCDAQVARMTPTHIGIKFIDLQDADRARLGAIVASRRSLDVRGETTSGI